jgi:hypothetical protein
MKCLPTATTAESTSAAAATVAAITAATTATTIPHHLGKAGVNMLLSLLQDIYEVASLLGIWIKVSKPH